MNCECALFTRWMVCLVGRVLWVRPCVCESVVIAVVEVEVFLDMFVVVLALFCFSCRVEQLSFVASANCITVCSFVDSDCIVILTHFSFCASSPSSLDCRVWYKHVDLL